jgi:hypothetical protein
MPYRARKIDWSLMIGPRMAGIEAESRASENLSRAIFQGLSSIGEGAARKRQEAESRRRFDAQMGMAASDDARADAKLGLEFAEYEQRQEERQANDAALLDELGMATDAVNGSAATTGQPDPQAASRLNDVTGALGGARAAMDKWTRRIQFEAPT